MATTKKAFPSVQHVPQKTEHQNLQFQAPNIQENNSCFCWLLVSRKGPDHKNQELKRLTFHFFGTIRTAVRALSQWLIWILILMSCQPHRVTSGSSWWWCEQTTAKDSLNTLIQLQQWSFFLSLSFLYFIWGINFSTICTSACPQTGPLFRSYWLEVFQDTLLPGSLSKQWVYFGWHCGGGQLMGAMSIHLVK